MSNLPADLKYAATHEWARLDKDGTLLMGITDFAQEQLGDLVYIQLPDVGKQLREKDQCATLESVKTASDIYSPIAGEVVEINQEAANEPQLVNEDPYGTWLLRIKPQGAPNLDTLLDADAYRSSIDT
jgi:glycine cleavage system H protein